MWLCFDVIMTLLLRCVSAGIEVRCHLGHAYIISNTLYTLAVLQWLLVPPRQCLFTYFWRSTGRFVVPRQQWIYGTNNCWFPLARKWPTWKLTWIWILYGKIEKKCPRYFRRDSRGNPRDLNMCRTGRSAALSRGRKSMPPRRESMKLVVQQRKFT